MFDSNNYRLKSVYLPKQLCADAETQAKLEYMNFSAYVRRLIVDDLRKNNLTQHKESN